MVPSPYPQPQPATPRPSTGLKVMGIVQIVFGVFGLLGAPITVAVALLNGASKDPIQRKLHALMWEGPVGAWSYAQAAIGLVLAVLLLAGGVGVVRGKLWGRTASLVYGVGTLVMLVAGQMIMAIAVYPMLLDELDTATSPVQRAGAMGGLVGGIAAALFGMILPIVVLIVLGRRSARAQLG